MGNYFTKDFVTHNIDGIILNNNEIGGHKKITCFMDNDSSYYENLLSSMFPFTNPPKSKNIFRIEIIQHSNDPKSIGGSIIGNIIGKETLAVKLYDSELNLCQELNTKDLKDSIAQFNDNGINIKDTGSISEILESIILNLPKTLDDIKNLKRRNIDVTINRKESTKDIIRSPEKIVESMIFIASMLFISLKIDKYTFKI